MYLELKPKFHLAYADQREGHGTQHYFRVFFDDSLKEKIPTVRFLAQDCFHNPSSVVQELLAMF